MLEDHKPLTVTDFRGLFSRGEDEIVPRGFWSDSQNNQFFDHGFETRDGSELNGTLASVKRIKVYKRIGEADRLLVLGAAGNLYDSLNLLVPILTVATMTDFSCVVLFNRAYITPHDGVTGLAGEVVYVYSGSGVARAAGGIGPTGFTLTAVDSATSGTVEAGTRVIAVAYITSTGFVTKIGGHVAFTGIGGRKIDLSNIAVGGASVIERILVSTVLIADYNGDVDNQTYYFIPDGTIANNIATTYTVDFFDADLQDDASYLAEQIATIPAGVGIGEYKGKMIVWGENLNPSIVRVSKNGESESFNAIEGFVTVRPGDGTSGVKNCATYRNQLLLFKQNRCYVTVDNNDTPVTWEVDDIDMSVGTECHGIAQVLDYGETLEDLLFVASRSGFRVFNGTFLSNPLTYNIDSIWDRINRNAFNTIECTVDSDNAMIYIAIPLDSAVAPNCLLIGDYNEGLTVETIKWDIWRFPIDPVTIAITLNAASKKPYLNFASENIYRISDVETNDFGTAIDSYARFALMPDLEDQSRQHFGGVMFKVRGSGRLLLDVYSIDDDTSMTPRHLLMGDAPGRNQFRAFSFISEKCSLRIRASLFDHWYRITKYTLYAQPLWFGRPSEPIE